MFLTDHVRLVLAGSENLATEVKRVRVLLDQKGEASEVGLLLKTLDNQTKEIETQVVCHNLALKRGQCREIFRLGFFFHGSGGRLHVVWFGSFSQRAIVF